MNDQDNRQILQQVSSLTAYAASLVVIWFWTYRSDVEDSRSIPNEIRLEGEQVRNELLSYLFSSELCFNIIRMTPSAFIGLCEILIRDGGLRPTLQVTVEEQVAKALWLLAHNMTNRELSLIFRRSGESVSRHFHTVLRAILGLYEKFIKQPDGSQVPYEIASNQRFYPYFKVNTTTIFIVCKCKYYLVDGGIMLRSGLITPCRGERYHLKEYSRNPPRNPRELFNLRHASLRNAIERAFGVLKKRFPIIASSTEPSYGVGTQKLIIFACCILHNYLRGVNPNDELLVQVDVELMNSDSVPEEPSNSTESNDETQRGETIRDQIAASMWSNYQA
ncbi:uncharacterized protein LOC132042434 [Lycium ferocissimum]|uniref:uncharacterized protein LOC132042434 n=1 Tax=Lycium ferocissimum TaxID=112874 RepID=UPI002814A51D|nr:uncharacterized protein LOC132042434 [Lycium ferocissimum]